MAAPPQTIVVYTRKGLYPDGRNVLCVDGAVLWVTEAALHAPAGGDLRTSLRASYDAVIAAAGGTLTEAQKAKLKEFYEISD